MLWKLLGGYKFLFCDVFDWNYSCYRFFVMFDFDISVGRLDINYFLGVCCFLNYLIFNFIVIWWFVFVN